MLFLFLTALPKTFIGYLQYVIDMIVVVQIQHLILPTMSFSIIVVTEKAQLYEPCGSTHFLHLLQDLSSGGTDGVYHV